MTVNVIVRAVDGATNTHHTDYIYVPDEALDHVLFGFNVTADPKVASIKALCGALIQKMRELRDAQDQKPAQKRGASIAITLIEGAQMAAVKALFAKA